MNLGEHENRQIARDSLFVLVALRLDGQHTDYRVKMRNLSTGGMMAEGPVQVTRGSAVWVDLRNIGWTEGSVAWVQDSRFGIAFSKEIDPKRARAAADAQPLPDGFILPRQKKAAKPRNEGPLRKV